ncbi:two component transcriptional regulator, winged helix family [Gottschalkia purinilytica]|uniref:Two component transcriptional regulator, winged helix family n=1 Tax=Gottschalkia purinilytica TaxID=1503 RepID=A0A0L0W9Y7_GOTPU|nr:response regulator transcription factor [Gottschalkia purinilytica]KNF08271.1 two component transcriptional regulator, winged helix family [Gottschalkia purinilytica]
MTNILLVEDDESLNRGISFRLTKEGFKIFTAETVNKARELFYNENIDLIIMDVGLPDGSGFELCNEIRKNSDVLVLFLTACNQEIDIVRGYDVGGDDYVTKPFSLMVLISKINAILRRSNKEIHETIVSRDIVFYPQEMKVTKNEEEICLSKTELKLMKYLIDNAQQIVTKEQLLSQIWDSDGIFIDQNTIAVNIRRLREKIEDDPSEAKYIKNVRGLGYIWAERCMNR